MTSRQGSLKQGKNAETLKGSITRFYYIKVQDVYGTKSTNKQY